MAVLKVAFLVQTHEGNCSFVVSFTTLQYLRLYGGIAGKHLEGSSHKVIKELYWNESG